NIEFLGRIDSQIKIRGFRIEPGEIENQLLNYKDVTGAVVISPGDEVGDKHLCAYIVSDKEISIPPLKEYLSHSLPYYMIPSYVIQVDKVPVTVHGKVNRKALPKSLIEKPTAFVAPRDWWEEQMAVLWAEVLGVAKEMLSIDTNFFEIGGQSLKATILTTKIHKALKVKIPLAVVFKTPFIRGLAEYIKKTAPNQAYTTIEPAESKEYDALSPTQKGIYILQRLDPSSTAYHIPFFLEIKGTVDKQRFEEAFRALIKRHGSLRTSFDMVNGEPVQKIHHQVKFEIEYYDLQVKNAGDRCRWEDEGTRGLAPLSIESFDLSVPPLFRVGMIRLQEKRHILMVDIHHIISDGTSINILVEDFAALYLGKELPTPNIQYKDYSQWQNSRQRREIIAKQEMVWLKEFAGELPLLNLPLDFPRPSVQEFVGSSLAFELSPQQTQTVKNFVLKERVTIYMMVLSVFTLLMAKLSGQEDIIVGTPAAGRNHENLQSIVGMFVNTLALRNFPVFHKTFKEFLHSVKEKTLTAFENQDFPFEELVDRLGKGIPRDKGRNPLFDVMVAPQEVQLVEVNAAEIPGLKLEPYNSGIDHHRSAKFDLTLTELETPGQLFFTLVYRTRLFKEETIRRFINYFKKVFTTVVKNPQIRIGEIEIITENEKLQILEEFNDTAAQYPGDKTLHQLSREQVERTPDRIALHGSMDTWRHEGVHITYRELNERSNRLAHVLRERGVKADSIVGIMLERSLEMIVGILGILKAGGAYMPIDPDYPNQRTQYMLTDSKAKFLVTTSSLVKEVEKNFEIVLLDLSLLPSSHLHLPRQYAPATSLAYVIYTSGSTGKPYGVMVEHRNAVNVVWWFDAKYQLDGNTHVLQMSDYTFDPSVNQIFGALTRGAVLYLISKEELVNVGLLRHYIEKHQIHLVNFVPKLLNHLLSTGPKLESIKAVICGGERLDDHIKDNILGIGYRLYNQYGPTEATIDVSMEKCSGAGTGAIIGKPIANVRCYIVDKNNNLSPIGVPGELWIAGAGVARGYLNNPELTFERFLFVSYKSNKSYRPYISKQIYITGDLVRWLSNGSLEFLGRMDYQVKIRGFRVELGEIENQLRRMNGVKDAVVIGREGQRDEKYLCAYIVARENIDMSHIRDELAKRLPLYMIPAFFVPLEEFPLTPNGKVDRKALPEPGPQLQKNNFHNPPRHHMEEKLADIWANVLSGRDVRQVSIGIDDNFFELGGNSLKAIQLISRIHETFNIEIPISLIFKTPFIRSISAHLMQHTFTATEEEIVLSLSPGKTSGENIFCFPPAVGYGIAYMALVPLLDNYSLYAFNYIDDKDKDRDKMEKYVDTIMEIQPQGPYTLLGYSAGGRLCLKAVELLEKQGNQVKDIILLDCYSQRKSLPVDAAEERSREFDDQLKQGLKELGLEPLTDKVMDTMEKYAQYHDTLQESEPAALCANIHLIKAEDKQGQEGFIGWEAFARGEYHEYEGFGIHKEML
ncbi:MAG: amino acid adenylation domain-containing protein, partial [Candidatus Aminicenantes bacterium]